MEAEKKYILVLEDEPAIQLLVVDILEAAGYEVAAFARGTDMLKAVRERRPDLIVSDLNVPGLDGNQTMVMMRRSGTFDGPIVVLSGRSREEDEETAKAAGAQAFLHKPVNRAELLATIARLLLPQDKPAIPPPPPAQ